MSTLSQCLSLLVKNGSKNLELNFRDFFSGLFGVENSSTSLFTRKVAGVLRQLKGKGFGEREGGSVIKEAATEGMPTNTWWHQAVEEMVSIFSVELWEAAGRSCCSDFKLLLYGTGGKSISMAFAFPIHRNLLQQNKTMNKLRAG